MGMSDRRFPKNTENIYSLPYTINQLMICTKISFFYLLPETCWLVCGLQTNKIKFWSLRLHRFARLTHSRECIYSPIFFELLKILLETHKLDQGRLMEIMFLFALFFFLCQNVPDDPEPSRDKFLCSLLLGGWESLYSFILILVQVNL